MVKTTCDDTVERLPWWLNGTLGEAEARRVEDHLDECTACAGELVATREALAMHALHPPIDALVDHVEGEAAGGSSAELGAPSGRAVEEHLEHCSACREEISLLRASRAAIEADEGTPRPKVEAFGPRVARRGPDRRVLALAASLVLFAVAAGGWFLTGRLAEERGDRIAELESHLAALSEPTGALDTLPEDGPDVEDSAAWRGALEVEAAKRAERIAELEQEIESARRVAPTADRLAAAVGVGPTFSWRLAEPVLRGGPAVGEEPQLEVPRQAEGVSIFVEEVGPGPLRLEIEGLAGERLLVRDGLRPFDHPLLGRHLTITLPIAELPARVLRLRLFEGDREVGSLRLRIVD